MVQPQVIFLDAVGTLFGVRGSVGDRYREVATQFGVDVDATTLNQAFRQSFRHSRPPEFPGVLRADLPEKEFAWWLAIAYDTFTRAGVIDQFSDFEQFFRALYAYFATAEAWTLYPDVKPTLAAWRSRGIRLGILSNFDTRLYAVLDALELTPFFSSFTLSTEVGAAKPSPGIFATAIAAQNITPETAWHIGDSYSEDYEGATQAGLTGIWITRSDESVPLRTATSPAPTPNLQLPTPVPSLGDPPAYGTPLKKVGNLESLSPNPHLPTPISQPPSPITLLSDLLSV